MQRGGKSEAVQEVVCASGHSTAPSGERDSDWFPVPVVQGMSGPLQA